MSFLEDVFKGGNIVTGVAMGMGARFIAPVVTPMLRPIGKSLLKVGLIAYDQGRIALAELNEQRSGLVAEARSELPETGRAEATSEGGAAHPQQTTDAISERRNTQRARPTRRTGGGKK